MLYYVLYAYEDYLESLAYSIGSAQAPGSKGIYVECHMRTAFWEEYSFAYYQVRLGGGGLG